MKPLWQLGAGALHAGFAAREFTPEDALASCLERSRACQGAVNPFIALDDGAAREAAAASTARWQRGEPLGPLDGVPVSLKDNLHARGWPTSWGSRLLAATPQGADEAPVARLRSGGAVIFGKTNLPEFALQGITESEVGGVTRNPWDLSRTPGGSSGGAAAAVASGCGPLALTTDGGGSTRRPASHCGVVGFKPSAGLVRRGGGLPEIYGDHEVPGVIARDVQDAAHAMQVLAPAFALSRNEKPARILYVPRFGAHRVDTGISAEVGAAAQRLASLGHTVEVSAPVQWAETVNELWPAYSARGLARLFDQRVEHGDLGDLDEQKVCEATRASLKLGREAQGIRHIADAAIRELRERMALVFRDYDAILTPATAALPWPVGRSHPATIDGHAAGPRGHAVFTAFANAAGLCAIAVPAGFVHGLPCGFQLVAAQGNDAGLIALALAYEQAFPRAAEWPTP
ncbi:amidase [Ramlibacter sp. PS4R-6]|uniref:amidase n=1 Tax=Ramlibacter sp. PS4R-6 TaxID=3133438 RepID=UPI0030A0DEEA